MDLALYNQVDGGAYPEFNDAINDWKYSPTEVWFHPVSSGWQIRAVNSNYGSTTWSGMAIPYEKCCFTPEINDMAVLFNDYFMLGYSTEDRRHVECHELGHALTLGHNGEVSCMNLSFAWWYVQQHDINDMNAYYP